MNKKTKIIIGVILVVVIFFVGRSLLTKEEKKYETVAVKKGTVSSEIIETGAISSEQKINLSFQTSGQINSIYVKEGELVNKGAVLANINNEELLIQLEESKANLEVAQAQLDKLQSGATQEEIAVSRSKVEKARTAYNNTKESLKNTQERTENNLVSVYENALQTLEKTVLTVNETYNFISDLQDSYFNGSDIKSYRVRNNEEWIKEAQNNIEDSVNLIYDNYSRSYVDQGLEDTIANLKKIKDSLRIIYDLCHNPPYDDEVPETKKDALDVKRSNINQAFNNIVETQQNIRSTRLSNQKALNEAESLVDSTQEDLNSAQKNLELLISDPQPEELALYEAKVRQARSQKRLLEERLSKTRIVAPVDCKVINIKRKAGESVTASQSLITVLPNDKPQIKVDLYEEDVPEVDVGDPVDIEVIALPKESFTGEVIDISPGGKLENGVVYYEITIALNESSSKLKPEMTADVAIKTETRKDVLVIPEDALKEDENNNYFVWVYKNKKPEKRIVKIGLEGEDKVEITDGLKIDDQVITNNWE